MKILLVDDDAFLRDMYATKFTESGYEVLVAKNGQEGLQILEKEQDIDVVMLDMIMPGLSGLELLAEVKKLEFKKEPKVLILSNQNETVDVEAAKKEGALGYIVKAEMIPSDVVEEVKKLTEA